MVAGFPEANLFVYCFIQQCGKNGPPLRVNGARFRWLFALVASQIFTVKIMPKQKTHKGMQKRFKITASGKAKHRKANRGHILGKKSGDRKRRLRGDGVVTGTVADKIADALRPGL